MTSVDYTGRTVDLLIFQGVAEEGRRRIHTGWGDQGEVCTGIQKVAQSWTMLFLTDDRTVLNKPTRGSGFLNSVRRGRIQVEGDVPAEFALAADKVKRTMALDAVGENLPDDERLSDARLQSYSLDRASSSLYLKVYIRSVAGETRTIFLPVPVAIK